MLIYGINPISEAIRTGAVIGRLHVATGKESNPRIAGIIAKARERQVPVDLQANLQRLTRSDAHQGIAAELPGLVRQLPPATALAPWLVMFDSIMDPHNFGAALRVCAAFGFDQVIFHKGNSSGITPAAVKVSAGAAFHVTIFESNLNKAVRQLQEAGYGILVLDADGDQTIYDCPLPEKLCLVIGAEDKGVRFAIQRLADQKVAIPMRGKLDSLNVSTALSAALCELSRRLPWPE